MFESDPPSSDHLTLQAVAQGVVDQDADAFFRSTWIRPLITLYIASCTPPLEELVNSQFRDFFSSFFLVIIAMVLL